ncbi:N-acetylglucosamine-6-phosphate deacetylase [Alteromonas facilis]|uniref:N-acetylglucosamine-6-phosphate deacetylase n=1 Tax=Alteromonas facilis TaxID=2048004 RepID=UPI000C28B737|nr:N-acetylglucosamine-6-phosphate deacetylase [Alteromonas facilis]
MKITCDRILMGSDWKTNQTITIDNEIITDISPTTADKDTSAIQVNTLIPGFIDIQVNGGGGVLFNQTPNAEALHQMFNAHQAYGTTAMLPTLITDCERVMQQAADAIAEVRSTHPTQFIGIHFEGPWLSQARKGVHPPEFIRSPSAAELAILKRQDLGLVMVTIAPEHVPTDIIKDMVESGIIVFLGHSAATYQQVQSALDAGASGFTHLFNAMSPLQSREPGMVGAALAHDGCTAGLIVDGYHVDPVCCQIAIKTMGIERIALVTDAMALAACEANEMPFFDTTIRKENGKLTTPDGTLAGSCLTMHDALLNAQRMCNVSLAQAAYMASTSPAKALGIEHLQGHIAVGCHANLVALDDALAITHVFQQGRPL